MGNCQSSITAEKELRTPARADPSADADCRARNLLDRDGEYQQGDPGRDEERTAGHEEDPRRPDDRQGGPNHGGPERATRNRRGDSRGTHSGQRRQLGRRGRAGRIAAGGARYEDAEDGHSTRVRSGPADAERWQPGDQRQSATGRGRRRGRGTTEIAGRNGHVNFDQLGLGARTWGGFWQHVTCVFHEYSIQYGLSSLQLKFFFTR